MCHAQPPKAKSLQEFWQSSIGHCGALIEKNGGYEFSNLANKVCAVSASGDLVIFVQNGSEPKKQYLIIPTTRIVVHLLQ